MNSWLDSLGTRLARYLGASRRPQGSAAPVTATDLLKSLQPADVLLVEGNSRVSTAIKFLTQSTWSHAALFIGADARAKTGVPTGLFIEADMVEGVRQVGIDAYAGLNTRICRPVGLTEADRQAVIRFAMARIGHQYDLRNVIDLARYLLPTPPVPARFRRQLIAFGSGDPTRAICSTLIAQAFQSVRYPILPTIEIQPADRPDCVGCVEEILRIRHHSLFVPRDFDISPYFNVVKPALATGFDYRALQWADRTDRVRASGRARTELTLDDVADL